MGIFLKGERYYESAEDYFQHTGCDFLCGAALHHYFLYGLLSEAPRQGNPEPRAGRYDLGQQALLRGAAVDGADQLRIFLYPDALSRADAVSRKDHAAELHAAAVALQDLRIALLLSHHVDLFYDHFIAVFPRESYYGRLRHLYLYRLFNVL